MKCDLIKANDYLIIVNNEKIDIGDYVFVTNTIMSYTQMMKEWGQSLGKKIVAHLPLNNAECLDGVNLLPPLVDDTKKWARSQFSCVPDDYEEEYYDGLEKGYNAAKEVYQFTLEDIKKAFKKGHEVGVYLMDYKYEEMFERFIESLKEPKIPVAFKISHFVNKTTNVVWGIKFFEGGVDLQEWKPKTVSNAEGKTQWVGNYIF